MIKPLLKNTNVGVNPITLDLESRQSLESYNLVNYSRTGTQTYFDSNGVLQTAPANTLPVGYEYNGSTWERKGWYIGQERVRLNTISEAPTVNENVTVDAVEHTISFYGTGTVTLSGAHSATINGTGAFPTSRTTLTFTPTAGTLTIAYSGTCEYVQLEEGGFTSPIIVGEGSQATRGASIADITDLSWYNQSEGTFVVETELNEDNSDLITASDGTNSNRIGIQNRTTINGYIIDGGSLQVNLTSAIPSLGSLFTVGISYKENNVAYSVNGSLSTDTNAIMPTISELQIGGLASGGQLNGYIKSLKYYPKRLSNSQLQALTS